MNCKKILPEFFGFEGIGILFRDHVTDHLFTIEQDDREGEAEAIKLKEHRENSN
jgi:hypothetical protein